jgi:hypothetical protein
MAHAKGFQYFHKPGEGALMRLSTPDIYNFNKMPSFGAKAGISPPLPDPPMRCQQ